MQDPVLHPLAKGRRGRFGGRKKGTPNKRDSKAAEQAREYLNSGLTPLEFLLGIMRGEAELNQDGTLKYTLEQRIDAAKAAAPYVHAKLQAVTLTGDGGGPIQFQQVTRVIRRT